MTTAYSTWRRWTSDAALVSTLIMVALVALPVRAWLPDTSSKVISDIGQLPTIKFVGNASYPDHFIVLNQDEQTVLLGARNTVYNLSVYDFLERKESRIEWQSSEAHMQLCILKGKSPEEDCENYIRIMHPTSPGVFLICGTNSFKPQCRYYSRNNGKYSIEREFEGIGVCPYDPYHNSTAVYSNGQLYSATVADFSGGDPLIYREPQRTELSDLKQLNAPNFVSSVPYGDYIFFFYRETAVEYINCGKVIYSRVARVCKEDKGGPHQFRDRWTSFLKTRLNCSVPGEYPFYFDEIQSTSDVVEGKYGSNLTNHVIYGTLTTPSNAIGGSAICVYNMRDVIAAFEGNFKQQEGINSNWLPVSKEKIPNPRPGQCVPDSRILPENNVNFVKTHSLMENSVPAMFGKPILIRVSLQYRFTAIAVDAQVATVDDGLFDVIYVGTDNGKVLKLVNVALNNETARAIVISENVILPNGLPITQLKIAPGHGKVIVVGRDEVRLAEILHCNSMKSCGACVQLQDPHCAWNTKKLSCVSLDKTRTLKRALIQDIYKGDESKCRTAGVPSTAPDSEEKKNPKIITNDIDKEIESTIQETKQIDPLLAVNDLNDCENEVDGHINCAVKQRLVIYTAETLQMWVLGAAILCLLMGFISGYVFSRKFHPQQDFTAPFIEQHNQLEGNPTNFLAPRPNKSVNLNVHVNIPPPPKKDNLETSKDLNIASDGTLQKKIKKTYI
ncbi:semaphorin-1A-like isoform X2 [Atheta coriaria]|uniref:semaphorin-1A-like isoform X2 n=1 Tax=Dalotia coriaria TaxID=877792 RepID=UPI0031F4772E